VLRVVVPGFLLILLGSPMLGQTILDGEFGAARKPLQELPQEHRRAAPRPTILPPAPSTSERSAAAVGSEAQLKAKGAEEIPVGSKRYPYHGVFDRAGEDGGSIVLAGKTKERVILITPRTNITRDGRRVSVKE